MITLQCLAHSKVGSGGSYVLHLTSLRMDQLKPLERHFHKYRHHTDLTVPVLLCASTLREVFPHVHDAGFKLTISKKPLRGTRKFVMSPCEHHQMDVWVENTKGQFVCVLTGTPADIILGCYLRNSPSVTLYARAIYP